MRPDSDIEDYNETLTLLKEDLKASVRALQKHIQHCPAPQDVGRPLALFNGQLESLEILCEEIEGSVKSMHHDRWREHERSTPRSHQWTTLHRSAPPMRTAPRLFSSSSSQSSSSSEDNSVDRDTDSNSSSFN